ncbi:Ppx/GppA phosphatase family protein [Brevundimonas sp.]|uniref:Ppx/GppA phosphatase family protein n=1 Tax=Brevundimonas sp. TaxID=1871086 RepID=UPI0025CD0555|nr:Ppx/GppA phosphatase family protein [Brevundimonas sp.]
MGGRLEQPCYAALDLGTNNCRLLIARKAGSGFRIIDAFSRIVRLGEGLSQSGELSQAAQDRAIAALKVCADKIARRKAVKVRAVATQACRGAANGEAFLERAERETGLRLEIIPPEEEARLSVAGCSDLIDRRFTSAIILDVGGGSTEMSWVRRRGGDGRPPELLTWMSAPIGVVTLAERFPEPETPTLEWFEAMVGAIADRIAAFDGADGHREAFSDGRAQLIGTSGAITSLAGLHLGLQRYERAKVDGLRMQAHECRAVADRLLGTDRAGRASEACIGPDRADLVLAGAAILEAVQRQWPCQHVRVADRGLREGMLLSLMQSRRRRRRR